MALAASDSTDNAGFTLVEVLIAMLLLSIVSLGIVGMFGTAIRATQGARSQTSTSALAEQKLEQLRSLTWGFDASGQNLPVTDTSTNLESDPPQSGGEGLNPSPSTSLNSNTPGYVDYLDANGRWVGTGSTPPSGATFIRRWSIQPLPTNPNNTLVLQVLVTTVIRETAVDNGGGNRRRYGNDALVATVKTRKGH